MKIDPQLLVTIATISICAHLEPQKLSSQQQSQHAFKQRKHSWPQVNTKKRIIKLSYFTQLNIGEAKCKIGFCAV